VVQDHSHPWIKSSRWTDWPFLGGQHGAAGVIAPQPRLHPAGSARSALGAPRSRRRATVSSNPPRRLKSPYVLGVLGNDGVSTSAAPAPTATLVALAAAGRNPTDIAIPTIGSEGSGGGGGDDDAITGGPSSVSAVGSSSATQSNASGNGSGTEVASAGNSSSTTSSSTNTSASTSGSSGGSSGSSGSSGAPSASSAGGTSSAAYAAAGGSSSGATSSSTGPSAAAGSTRPTSGGRVATADTEDDDEPQGSHLSLDDAYAVGYSPGQIGLAIELFESGMSSQEIWFRVGDPQNAPRQQKPRQPFVTINVKTPDEVVMGVVAKAEPVLRPYMVYGGATLSLVGHSAGFGTGLVLVVSPEPTASKGFGVYMMAVNADGIIADIRTLATGVPQSTLLHTAVRDGLIQAGMDEREAEKAATTVELASNGFQAYKVAVMMALGAVPEGGAAPRAGQFTNCFPADTLIATEHGQKPIQDIRASERVWSFDLVAKEWKLRHVIEMYRHEHDGDMVAVSVAGEAIESTGHHPWWVVRGEALGRRPQPEHVPGNPVGFHGEGRWVDAIDLRVGDVLLLRSGAQAPISRLSVRHARQLVYNFHVQELGCYAVGSQGVLVHNNSFLEGKTPLAGTRGTGVNRAIAAEVDLVRRTGQGTIAGGWTAPEIAFIQETGQLPQNIVGDHINNVAQFPDWAGDPRNIRFVRGPASNLAEHGGNFQNPTTGPLIDR
jgi:hypothetical protein